MIQRPFTPHYGQTQAVATAAGAVNATVPAGANQLLLTNVGTVLAFVRVKPNGSSADASAADMPLPAGAQRIISKHGDIDAAYGQTVVSVFAAGAGSTVYITPGEGCGP